ncbi:Arc family DNA-binding protein [Kibdelosporangium lantanae]|uniref:Arc family DNA-binding protein n=1 Tax=Kibdelosporangium lantanae TaxID=1497396 RepID=A0ABW3M7Y5_9PSEU
MINFNVRFPEDVHARVRAQAAADRRSINSEILHLLEIALATVAPRTPDRPGGDPVFAAPLPGKPDSFPA